ncbi:MAG: DNA-directed RNA polymerase subunit omega [Candidatus Kapaibacteriota bacterium]
MKYKRTINPILVRMKETEKGILYESIVAMGKRARQINDILKQELNTRLAEVKTSSETGETNFEQYSISKEFDNIPKPTIIAMQELYEDKLTYNFPEEKKQSFEAEK